jgi:hypothetical protein
MLGKYWIKALVLLSFFFTIMISPVFPKEGAHFLPRFSIKITKGWGPDLRIGDMNTHLESFNNMGTFLYYRQNEPELISGEIETLDGVVPDWNLEFRLDISRRIGLALGTSMPYQKANDSTIDWTMLVGQRMVYTIRPRIQVLPPVIWSVYYDLLPNSRFGIQLNLGGGLYLVRMSEYYNIELTLPPQEPAWWRWTWATDICGTIGAHVGVEIDIPITKAIALVTEFQGWYARVNKLYGSLLEETIYGGYDEYRGPLYFFTRSDDYTGDRYAVIQTAYVGPIWDFPANVRLSSFDLSRYSFRIGIKFKLF